MSLSGDERRRVGHGKSTDPETYRLYLQGRMANSVPSEENLHKAIGFYRKALARDANYALAYAGLADAYSYLGDMGTMRPRDVLPQAKAAAAKALELDDSLGEAHNSLGIVHLSFDWDFPAAKRDFERSLELNPGNAYDRHWYSHYLSAVGRWDESVSEMQRALELDPLSPMFPLDLAFLLAMDRRWPDAEAQARKLDTSGPEELGFQQGALALIYTGWKRRDEALAALSKVPEQTLAGQAMAGLGIPALFALLGNPERTRALREQLEKASKNTYIAPFAFAEISFGLGEKDRAFQELEAAYRDRDSAFTFLMASPVFDGVRSDPRLAAILGRVGLPDAAWR